MAKKSLLKSTKNAKQNNSNKNNTKNKTKIQATLIIMTKNEITGLNALFDKLPIKSFAEVIAIDAQSTDGSKEFLQNNGLKVVTQKKMGRAEAFRIGCALAHFENVIFFSPDGNEDYKDIEKLAYWLNQGYDIAVASRFMKGGRSDDYKEFFPLRAYGNRGFTLLANIIWRGNLTDSINGFRAIKRNKFWKLNLDSEGFGIEFQLSIRALKLRYKIKEIPSIEGDRIGGQSTAKTFQTGWYFVRLILQEFLIGKSFTQTSQIRDKYRITHY